MDIQGLTDRELNREVAKITGWYTLSAPWFERVLGVKEYWYHNVSCKFGRQEPYDFCKDPSRMRQSFISYLKSRKDWKDAANKFADKLVEVCKVSEKEKEKFIMFATPREQAEAFVSVFSQEKN